METEKELETRNEKPETSWLLLYAPLLIWIGVIFFLSSGQGASSQTSLIIRPLLEFVFPTASPETITFYHGIIRKLAHVTEYAVLGILACPAFAHGPRGMIRRRFLIFAGSLVVLIAATDEFNQSFNPDRTGSAYDVILDICGGLVAIGCYYLLRKRKQTTAV